MKFLNLLKNPVLRNKTNSKISNPVGDIVQEIQEQDIAELRGGNFERISAVTALTAWSALDNDRITQRYNCGSIVTISAKCEVNYHKPC